MEVWAEQTDQKHAQNNNSPIADQPNHHLAFLLGGHLQKARYL